MHALWKVSTSVLGLTLATSTLLPASATAQGLTDRRWEASGTYQVLRSDERTFPLGFNVDVARMWGSLGLVAETGWAWSEDESLLGVVAFDWHRWNVGVGGRWHAATGDRLRPFVQLLGGLLHTRFTSQFPAVQDPTSALFAPNGRRRTSTDRTLTLQPGIGLDARIAERWGLVGQFDYRRAFISDRDNPEPTFDGASDGENQFRLLVGVR